MEAETVEENESDIGGESEREDKRERTARACDGALHAHTDRDLRAVSGNRE